MLLATQNKTKQNPTSLLITHATVPAKVHMRVLSGIDPRTLCLLGEVRHGPSSVVSLKVLSMV